MVESSSFALRWERWQQRWDDFAPSKAVWAWSCLASSLLTVAVGFAGLGWMTRAQADVAAAQAANLARADLVARACVSNFANEPDFAGRLAALKDAGETARPSMILERGLVTLAGMDGPLAAAATLCADELATMHSPDMTKPKG